MRPEDSYQPTPPPTPPDSVQATIVICLTRDGVKVSGAIENPILAWGMLQAAVQIVGNEMRRGQEQRIVPATIVPPGLIQ